MTSAASAVVTMQKGTQHAQHTMFANNDGTLFSTKKQQINFDVKPKTAHHCELHLTTYLCLKQHSAEVLVCD